MSPSTFEKILKEYFSKGTDHLLPNVSINCIVFGYDHPNLKVLAQKIPFNDLDSWVVPGGFIEREEELEAAAHKILKQSGIKDVFLKQVGAFGGLEKMFDQPFIESELPKEYFEIVEWISKRFVQVVYYGIVNFHDTNLLSDEGVLNSAWMNIEDTSKLPPSHTHLVHETKKKLITETITDPIVLNFFPESFTLNQLRGFYEAILNRPIDRGTFRRKYLSMGLLEKVDEKSAERGRPSYLYKFNKVKYLDSLNEKVKFGF